MHLEESDAFGSALQFARGRARLTIEQLADRSGVDAGTLRRIEAGESRGLFQALDVAVRACSHDLTVLVRRELEEGEPLRRRRNLHILVTRLLVETEPREDLEWRTAMMGSGLYAALGLFGAAREILRSILLLDNAGHSYFALPGLVRQLWEYTATAEWILQDPNERAMRLDQDTNFHIQQMANEDGHTEELDRLVEMWRARGLPDESFARKMPPFSDRLVGFVRDWYPRYRNFSRFTHPTRYVVDSAFEPDGPRLAFRTEAVGETPWVAYGGCVVAALATQLELHHRPPDGVVSYPTLGFRTGLGFRSPVDAFTSLAISLENHTRPDAEMDRSAWAEDAPADPPWVPADAAMLAAAERPGPPPRRNEPCWCGSGKKYKKCHGRIATETTASRD